MSGTEIKPVQIESPEIKAPMLNRPIRQEWEKPFAQDENNACDKFTSSDSNVGKNEQKENVSFGQACKSFLNGFLSPLTALKNPLVLASLVACGLLAAVVPVTIPIMFAIGLVVSSGYLAKGITNAIIAGANGDGKRFANAFENIGSGTVGVLLARLSLKRCAALARCAKDRAAFPRFLPPRATGFKADCQEIFTLFSTRFGLKSIATSFGYPKGIKLSLGTLKHHLQMLIFNRPGTPYSAFYGWKHWFGSLCGFIGRFLPTWNQPVDFSRFKQGF